MIILTDLSEVLIGGLEETAKIIANRFGDDSSAQCWERIQKTKNDFEEVLRGHLEESDYYRIFFAGEHFSFNRNDLEQAFSEAFKVAIPGTLKLYQRIIVCPQSFKEGAEKRKGMPDVYIASDHIAERKSEIILDHPGIFRVVKEAFWSCDLGAIKSDSGYFPRLLSIIDADADEIVFIDNNPKNIVAAERSGIKSILFTDAVFLEYQLSDLGFVIGPATL